MQHFTKEEIKNLLRFFQKTISFLTKNTDCTKKKKGIQNEIHGIYRKLFVTKAYCCIKRFTLSTINTIIHFKDNRLGNDVYRPLRQKSLYTDYLIQKPYLYLIDKM